MVGLVISKNNDKEYDSMELIRRYINNPQSGGSDSLFPLDLTLEKVSNDEYRLNPTPKTIALADYFNNNAVFNNIMHWEVYFRPGELYIDGKEIDALFSPDNGTNTQHTAIAEWEFYPGHFGGFDVTEFYVRDGMYPKGTLRIWNDD